MRIRAALCIVAFLVCVDIAHAAGASLSVTPITVERIAPAAAATLTLSNSGDHQINVQVRVLKWTQADGADYLEPTKDVVASPPMMRLSPGTDYTIRVVRISKVPVVGEESYRIVVDELPQRNNSAAGVKLLVRYSIPCFFKAPEAAPTDVVWQARAAGSRIELLAENRGGSRFKVGETTLTDAAGRNFTLSAGLLGYVLPGAWMRWSVKTDGARGPRTGPGALRIVSDGIGTDVPVDVVGR